MPSYRAPLSDMQFLLEHVFKVDELWASMPALESTNLELATAVLEEGAKLCEKVLQPINQIGDQQGCILNEGKVTTPDGFKAAWAEFSQSGWVGLAGNAEYEGQGLPKMLSILFEEMVYSANCSFQLYSGLTAGAALLIDAHANENIKQTYLPKLYTGEWAGSMCLTEPHAGTDLGLIKTKASKNKDESYTITGTKIFITGGDQDLTENIVHLVLAKAEGSPDNVKGISLFLVPKNLPDNNQFNHVNCGALEHKMGIKGSATALLNFDGAQGWLVGELDRGLNAMFTMMNYERLSIGIQGIGLAQVAFENSFNYAKERKQSRAPNAQETSFIVDLPDVQRMLMTQKVFIESGRCFALYVGQQLDLAKYSNDEIIQKIAADRVALLTPIAKIMLTDGGFESCVHAQQVLGGHGYISEWGIEQFVRDARIAQIYEGTNGIQALDLLGRKVMADQGVKLNAYLDEINDLLNTKIDFPYKRDFEAMISKIRAIYAAILERSDIAAQINGLAVEFANAMTVICQSHMWVLQYSALDTLSENTKAEKMANMNFQFLWVNQMFDTHINRIQTGWQTQYSEGLSK
jgi:alkylation response protein AidB-like acyl-CoA dehydrogenase